MNLICYIVHNLDRGANVHEASIEKCELVLVAGTLPKG